MSLRHDRLHRVYRGMMDRCYNPSDKAFKDYGKRGITVCSEWRRDYWSFHLWAMENGYDYDAPEYQCTIDRIDNNRGYSPNNCRWVSMKVQNCNRQNTCHWSYQGRDFTTVELSEMSGVPVPVITGRLNIGWTVEDAITKPVRGSHSRTLQYEGKTFSMTQLARVCGVSYAMLYRRIVICGKSVEDAVHECLNLSMPPVLEKTS